MEEQACLNTDLGKTVFESRGIAGHEAEIEQIKAMAAALWSAYVAYCPASAESNRLMSIAKTNLETSVMFAVKSFSRG